MICLTNSGVKGSTGLALHLGSYLMWIVSFLFIESLGFAAFVVWFISFCLWLSTLILILPIRNP